MSIGTSLATQPQHEASRSPFDTIKELDGDGRESWSARRLMPYVGYPTWKNAGGVIARAKAACLNSGFDIDEHFLYIKASADQGGKAGDIRLSRRACYLIAMNGDPIKPEIAAAQRYFAEKTREAELGIATAAIGGSLATIRPEFNAARDIALMLGFQGNQAILAAARAISRRYDVDLPSMFGLALESPNNERLLIPTEIGRILNGIRPQEVNIRLQILGFQQREPDGRWVLTEAGKEFGVYLDVLKGEARTASTQQIKWRESVVEKIRSAERTAIAGSIA